MNCECLTLCSLNRQWTIVNGRVGPPLRSIHRPQDDIEVFSIKIMENYPFRYISLIYNIQYRLQTTYYYILAKLVSTDLSLTAALQSALPSRGAYLSFLECIMQPHFNQFSSPQYGLEGQMVIWLMLTAQIMEMELWQICKQRDINVQQCSGMIQRI